MSVWCLLECDESDGGDGEEQTSIHDEAAAQQTREDERDEGGKRILPDAADGGSRPPRLVLDHALSDEEHAADAEEEEEYERHERDAAEEFAQADAMIPRETVLWDYVEAKEKILQERVECWLSY